MKKDAVLSVLKWLWMLAVLLAFAVYIGQNFGDILQQLNSVPMALLLMSLALAMLGRILFITMSSEVLSLRGYPQAFRHIFYVAAVSELGKYLPGGVWHLLGRAAYYKVMGLPLAVISRALIQENAWMLLSSGMMGAIFLILGYTGNVWIVGLLLVLWWLMLYLFVREAQLRRISLQLPLQMVVWLLFAASFSLLLPDLDAFGWFLSMGAFCVAWFLGVVILFAPGGLGVREAVLVAFLAPIMPPEEALIFALLHRLIWVLIEFGYGLIAWLFLDLKGTTSEI